MIIDRSNAPFPQIWHRFQVETPKGILKFKIEDLPKDRFDEAIDIMLEHFTADEPPCKHIGIRKYPSALAEIENLWRTALKDQISVACFLDNGGHDERPKIAGVNILAVAGRDEHDEPFESSDEIWTIVFGAVDLIARSVDIFERYHVDKYLNAYGLVVLPEYRGYNIGKEILLARIPLCKALGIKVTATVFTAAASQKIAKKAGFETIFEMDYTDIAKQGFIFPDVEKSTKSSMLMALVID